MDELSLASGLLSVVLVVVMIVTFNVHRDPPQYDSAIKYVIGPLFAIMICCVAVNGGIALGHMLRGVP